jgi:hypothetical protein
VTVVRMPALVLYPTVRTVLCAEKIRTYEKSAPGEPAALGYATRRGSPRQNRRRRQKPTGLVTTAPEIAKGETSAPACRPGASFTPYRTWTPRDRAAATLPARVPMQTFTSSERHAGTLAPTEATIPPESAAFTNSGSQSRVVSCFPFHSLDARQSRTG